MSAETPSPEKPGDKNISEKKLTDEEKEDMQDDKDLMESLELLKKVKGVKGQELPPSMGGMLEGLQKKHLGEERSEDFQEASKGLDMVKGIKEKKMGKAKDEGKESQEKACLKCGQINSGDANFCGRCGEKFEKKDFRCSKCGTEAQGGDIFCRNCGNKIKEMSKTENEPSQKSSIKTRMKGSDVLKELVRRGITLDEYTEELQGGEIKRDKPVEQIDLDQGKKVGKETTAEKGTQFAEIRVRGELLSWLDSIEGIQGASNFFKSEELKNIVKEVLDSGDESQLRKIMRSQGLRDKVNEIMIIEKINKAK